MAARCLDRGVSRHRGESGAIGNFPFGPWRFSRCLGALSRHFVRVRLPKGRNRVYSSARLGGLKRGRGKDACPAVRPGTSSRPIHRSNSCPKVSSRMGSSSRTAFFLPVARAIGQLDDPAITGVLLRSLAWSITCFAALHVGAIWIIHRTLALHGWLAWGADVLGSVAASLLALWLFLPVATAIGMMYSTE